MMFCFHKKGLHPVNGLRTPDIRINTHMPGILAANPSRIAYNVLWQIPYRHGPIRAALWEEVKP